MPPTTSKLTRYAAFLRAVNVGGTGKLPMSDLRNLCGELGFTDVKTYLASGNVALDSSLTAARTRAALEARLEAHAGKPVGVIIRTATQLKASGQARSKLNIPASKAGTARNINTLSKMRALLS